MSAKWVRSQRWDDQHLTGVLWPAKVVLRLFSWISTAIVLLSLVAVYGILASVPIGLIAKLPTVLFDAATFAVVVGAIAVLPVWFATRAMRSTGVGRASRVAFGIIGFAVLALAGVAAWYWGVWPSVRYDPITGSGVRFFGAFIDRYIAVQFRRLPMMEMSELEFYGWWPLRVVLLLFVMNLVVATIRRIEFTVPRIGVLTVHTGIVTIALGSIYYATHKQEGDVLLLAGGEDPATGKMIPARAERGFYDNTRTALWVTQNRALGWDQRPLRGVPRYNDYNLDVLGAGAAHQEASSSFGPIDVSVPDGLPGAAEPIHLIDDDIRFRIVGYASYAELAGAWVGADKLDGAAGRPERVRALRAVVTTPAANGEPSSREWQLLPDRPARRAMDANILSLEYTIGMSDERWNALATQLPPGVQQALLVEVPGAGFREVYPVQPDASITAGTTGYRLKVQALMPRPPMPIVTKGYEGATSSLVIVHVEPPGSGGGGPDAKKPPAFDRWVYSRFPEITQDLLDELNDRGMPKRRDADPGIRITYIDASKVNVYFDERPDGTIRSLVRAPGGAATITPSVKPGDRVQFAPMAAIELGGRMDNAVFVETPSVVPEEARNRDRIGNHEASAVAVEVRGKNGPPVTRWVPFTQYLSIDRADDAADRDITLPDGRVVSVAFGRVRHNFDPEMTIQLHEFEMIPYEHSDTPRDYRSDVVIRAQWLGSGGEELRRTSLNNPLLVVTPYVPFGDTPWLGRVLGAGMSFLSPNQYKFSQAGWDQAGWRESEREVAAGRREKPAARFTILGVGTNPGIHIIAAGAVMMSVGIPWAFYLKPWLMQRQKKRIQKQLARDGASPSGRGRIGMNGSAGTHAAETNKQGAGT